MKTEEFLAHLQKNGRYSFTTQEAEKALGISRIATLNALHRLSKNKLIISPVNGFYLFFPPEYHAYGCLPANMFIDDLMKYFNLPYYIGFLSAADFYGAAHQKPQRLQVVTTHNHAIIQCGRIVIQFIAHKNMITIPTKLFNTVTGTIKVATPEVIAADIVSSPASAAGIDNVATVLLELAEQIDSDKLIELTQIYSKVFWVQRLGYLCEHLGFKKLAKALEQTLKNKNLHWARLVASAPYTPLQRNKKWRIIVNTNIEPDEI